LIGRCISSRGGGGRDPKRGAKGRGTMENVMRKKRRTGKKSQMGFQTEGGKTGHGDHELKTPLAKGGIPVVRGRREKSGTAVWGGGKKTILG